MTTRVETILTQWAGKRGKFKHTNSLEDLAAALNQYGDERENEGYEGARSDVRHIWHGSSDKDMAPNIWGWLES